MTLATFAPSISRDEFTQLPQTQQLDALRCQDARRKTELLLDAANGAELMAKLSPQEVYLLAVERGPEHLPELLGLASPAQWTGFFDLDCWDGDTFDVNKTRRWIKTLLANDDDYIFATLKQMNFEQLTLLFKSEVEVMSGPEAMEDDDARAEAVRREGGYELHYRDEEGSKLVTHILDILHRYETGFFQYLLESVRAESMSMIVESVYQQRAERLSDMGIPDPFLAQKVYAFLDPQTYRNQRAKKFAPGCAEEMVAPGFVLTLARPQGLLAELLTEGLDEAASWEFATLINKVMLADKVELGDYKQVGEVVSKVDAYLNIALEWLSEKDLDKARRLLPECYFEELFRLGYSLIAQLQQRVRSLKSSSITPWLAHSDRDCIAALNQPSPAYFAGLDDPLHGGTRLFKNLDDLARVAERVTAICAEQQLFEDVFAFELPSPEDLDLSDCQPDDTDDLTLSDFFLTALANKLLGGEFEATPVAAEKLMTLHGMVAEESKVNSALRKEVTGWLGPLAPGGAAFAEQCMQRWDEEFCAVAAQDLDARFVRGIIVRM